jgi:hypothetical protein
MVIKCPLLLDVDQEGPLITHEGRDGHPFCSGDPSPDSLASRVADYILPILKSNPQPLSPVSHGPEYSSWWSQPRHEQRDPPCHREQLDHG